MNSLTLPQIKTIIFDFDGVLCKDRFYSSLRTSHPTVYDYIENQIFGSETELVDRWMRNEVSSDNISRMISQANNIEFNTVKRIFEKDILSMEIDQRLVGFIKNRLGLGRKLALVTNNMDVFSRLTVANHKLYEIFEVIVNSADYGLLKTDKNGKLFDIALEKIGVTNYNSVLLIDDSLKVKALFESKDGCVFTYSNFDEFIKWAKTVSL